jgi:hypothetical protein
MPQSKGGLPIANESSKTITCRILDIDDETRKGRNLGGMRVEYIVRLNQAKNGQAFNTTSRFRTDQLMPRSCIQRA